MSEEQSIPLPQRQFWTQEAKNRLTKQQLAEAGKQEALEQIEDGFIDPLKEYIKLRREIEFLTGKLEGLKPAAVEEAYNAYSEKKFELLGVTVEKKNQSGGRIDFKYDPVWVQQSAWLKEHEAKLKALKEGEEAQLTTGDGEQYTAVGPDRPKSSESITLTF
ncbi:MAG: hypothetical protein EOO39_00185 [Cytophagaceae bacterium]|nr:MAG: hypothetical protein EOO39_00185 [Cytophagaceae bacterium]